MSQDFWPPFSRSPRSPGIAIRVAPSGWIAIIATIAAATASMVLAEIGTSLEELLLSIPVLASICC